MSDKNESRMKERVLFLERFLLAHSDEKHPVTTAELIYACEEKGYNANRNTIHADMVALSASGLDVQSKRVGNAKGYYVDVRLFEYSALRMLVDAVSSSRFITERKSKELIGKIGRLTSDFMAEQLRTTIHTFKSNNPTAVRGTARIPDLFDCPETSLEIGRPQDINGSEAAAVQ